MACYHPVPVWQQRRSGDIVFNEPSRRDLLFYKPMHVACGQCIGCRLDKSRTWADRFMDEASLHFCSCVVTLSYSDEFMPAGGVLVKPHVQKFFRALKKRHPGVPIRRAYCGEYGDGSGARLINPHYHAAIFGYDFPDKYEWGKSRSGTQMWRSSELERLWPYGLSVIGVLDRLSGEYIGQYCVKKVNGDRKESHYRRIDPETGEIYQLPQEFFNVSTKPGLGAGFFNKFRSDMYPVDLRIGRGGEVRGRPPRYYDKLLKRQDAELLVTLKERREQEALLRADDNTPERLAVREMVTLARLATKGAR